MLRPLYVPGASRMASRRVPNSLDCWALKIALICDCRLGEEGLNTWTALPKSGVVDGGADGGAATSESTNSSQACTLLRLATSVPPMFWSADTYRLLAAASNATLPSGCGTSLNCSHSEAVARLETRSLVLGAASPMSAETKLPLM